MCYDCGPLVLNVVTIKTRVVRTSSILIDMGGFDGRGDNTMEIGDGNETLEMMMVMRMVMRMMK